MWRKLADVAFWIGLSLYFGGMITIGVVAARAIFQTARNAKLTMPGISDPPLPMGNQVGGELFGEVLNRFGFVEAIALALMLAGLAGWILGYRHVRRSTWVLLVLWALTATLAALDAGLIRPKVWALRTVVREQAPAHLPAGPGGTDEPWPEREEFDRLHRLDGALGQGKVYLLLTMLIVAAWRGPAEKREAST